MACYSDSDVSLVRSRSFDDSILIKAESRNILCPGKIITNTRTENAQLPSCKLHQLAAKNSAAEIKHLAAASNLITTEHIITLYMKTFIDAEEIAGMIVYLLSPLAKKITGQMLAIDGHTENLSMINKEGD